MLCPFSSADDPTGRYESQYQSARIEHCRSARSHRHYAHDDAHLQRHCRVQRLLQRHGTHPVYNQRDNRKLSAGDYHGALLFDYDGIDYDDDKKPGTILFPDYGRLRYSDYNYEHGGIDDESCNHRRSE